MDSMAKRETDIKNIREKLRLEYKLNDGDYYESDVERVLSDNWQIERFFLSSDADGLDEHKAFKALNLALKWRKSFGVLDRDEHYFPKEFYDMNETQLSGPDSEGRHLFWNSGRNVKKSPPEVLPLIVQFIVYHIELLDRRCGQNGMIMVTDFSLIGVANYDGEQVRQVNQILFEYYPGLLKYCYLVNFPTPLIPFFKLFSYFMNKNMKNSLKIMSMTEIKEWVAEDMIPETFGGKKPFRIDYPESVQTLEMSPHFKCSQKQKKLFYEFYRRITKK